jgi:undecaprenyl-diphosphatase
MTAFRSYLNTISGVTVDYLLLMKALIMGFVEGLTEFLPVSSTGHLILTESLIGFDGGNGKVFEIFIQSGAILAVCWEFRQRIAKIFMGITSDPIAQKFVINVFIAFLPLAILGLLFNKILEEVLFKPVPVAIAFIVGGILILGVERYHRDPEHPYRVTDIDQMTALDALKLGFAQACALIPGTSRSGATIIGGMLFGLSRKTATEFSFFLAIPTLFAATFYQLYKARDLLSMNDVPQFTVGFIGAFISAFLCVRWFLRYISTHDFTMFAWYRIAFGLVVLGTAHYGLVDWHSN